MSTFDRTVLPLYKKINDAQSDLFPLSLTAEFKVTLGLGYVSGVQSDSLSGWLSKCGIANSPQDLARYDFFASDVTLPGASFDMSETMGDRQGTIERFAQRRLYAPLQVTFYIDSDYNILRLFEEWMNFINPIHNDKGRYEGSFQGTKDYRERNNYYKFRYPNDYKRNLVVTKFEKDFYQGANMNETRIRGGDDLVPGSLIFYDFIDVFPSNIVAIPLTFNGTDVTKVQIEFQYLRYNVITNNEKDALYARNAFGFTERNYDNSVVGQLGATSGKTTTQPGFVNGELYTGPFHIHRRDDGTLVRMVGPAHVNYPHNVIYDTAEESLGNQSYVESSSGQQDQSQQQEQQQQSDTTAPAAPDNVSVTTPSSDNTPTITGNAEGGSTVKLFNGSVEIGSVVASSSGSFSITVSNPLPDATYTFTITATDSSGNISNSSTIAHTINTAQQQQQGGQQQGGQQQGGQQQGGNQYSPGY